MQLANRLAAAVNIDRSVRHPDVVLKPLSQPGLGEIRIHDAVFAIGRTEEPFASYGNDVVNMLSRRHAQIFRKGELVYLADLESRNGTSVNHVGIGNAPCQLRDGDEICFADSLSYRIQITPHSLSAATLTLALIPESCGSGLEPIVITKFPFLVSKTEATFSHYKSKSAHARQLGYLSRRHAYIYQKGDQVYLEDLDSGNGTFVDGVPLAHPVPLRDGVVVAFGGQHFVYRVSIARSSASEPTDSGVGESRTANPPALAKSVAEVRHLAEVKRSESKREAKDKPDVPAANAGAVPSGNVSAVRSANAGAMPPANAGATPPANAGAVPSANVNVVLPAGVSASPSPSVASGPSDSLTSSAGAKPNVPLASNKTQFMAAPTTFLEIFCEAGEPKEDVRPAGAAAPVAPAKEPPVSRRRRGRFMLLLSEVASLRAGGNPDTERRSWWKIVAVVVILGALAATAYSWNSPERELKNAVAHGEYARAAALATRILDKHPDDVDLKALATDASLKANVPTWLAKVRARDFDGAKGVLAGMSPLGKRDVHLQPMIEELEWLGSLERLISSRGGPEAPIRIYADEDSIERLIGSWNDDTGEHQRALARIASHVPQFSDFYGEALTHLRRLQSESTVYLPVIGRIKTNIATALDRDDPDALKPVLQETADRYPGLGGLDKVRQDLAGYIEIRRESRARNSGRLFAAVRKAHFDTPPFQQAVRALIDNGQLPPDELLRQYDAATRAWKDGNTDEALAGLQKMAVEGSWGPAAAAELARRQHVTARYDELQQSRAAADFVDQLLAFRESLDANEDLYFVRAIAVDLNQQKDNVIARAQEAMNRARSLWEEYRNSGAIDASQRIETSISAQFRNGARLLAEASKYAQQGLLIYSEVDPAEAAPWTAIRDEIEAEAREQRNRLNDLSNVVEPELLKAKLALLGDSNP